MIAVSSTARARRWREMRMISSASASAASRQLFRWGFHRAVDIYVRAALARRRRDAEAVGGADEAEGEGEGERAIVGLRVGRDFQWENHSK